MSVIANEVKQSSIFPFGSGLLRRFCLLAMTTFSLLPSPAQSQDITTGLVGHWTMDETSGTTITDSGSGGNDLIMYGGLDAGSDSTTGQISNALQFDATNDYASNASIDLSGTDAVTVALWVNRTYSNTDGAALFESSVNMNGSDTGFGFFPDDAVTCGAPGRLNIGFRGDSLYNTKCFAQPSSGTWHHLTTVFDKSQVGTSEVTLYIDGVLQTPTATPYSNDNTNNFGDNPFFLSSRAGTTLFNANTMDDVRIYTRALSAADVTALYNYTPPAATVNELVGHWTLDETSGSTITDSGTGGNDGTWSDSDDSDVTGETIAGQVSTGLDFDGTDDNVLIGDPADGRLDFNSSQSFSYSQWVRSSDVDVFSLSKRAITQGYEILIGRGGIAGTYGCRISDGGPSIYSTDFTGNADGAWHLVTCVIDRSTNELRIYGDGVLIGAPVDISGLGSLETSDNLRLGSRGAGNSHCDCDIDDTRIYNYAISPAEVTALYASAGNITTGLVGHWTLDETSGTTAADSSGNGNNGTLVNSPTWNTGNINGALDFDYTSSQYVNAGSDASLQLTNIGTVSAWVKYGDQSVSGSWTVIAGTANHNTDRNGYGLVIWPSNRLSATIDSASGHNQVSSPLAYSDDTWHHVAGAWDGSNLRLYVDGAEVNSTAQTLNAAFVYDFNIGRDAANANAYFNGSIDDVRVYGHALSATDIAALYTYTPPADTSTGLIGHWTLDETSGTTAVDSSGSGLDGTINGTDGATATTAGNDGTALDFDGSDDQIIIPDDAALDFGTNDFSVSYWVNKQALITLWDNYAGVGKWNSGASPGTNEWGLALGWTSATNTPSFYIESGATIYGAASPDDLTTGQWYHLLGVREGTNIKLYVDGALKATTPIGNVAVNNIGEDFNIGRIVANYTDAIFDDVRIYNRALSATDAAALYAGTITASDCTNPAAPPGTMIYNYDYNALQYCNGFGWMAIGPSTDLASGLVGHWAMDETSGASIADSSTNTNTGTWIDGDDTDVTGETTSGKVGTALTFDGTDDYALVPNTAELNMSDTITISAWVSRQAISGSWDAIVTRSENGPMNFRFMLNNIDNQLYITGDTGPSGSSTGTITDTNLHHVAVTLGNNVVTFYIDGNPAGTNTTSGAWVAGADLQIGRTAFSGGRDYFNGIIDDVRIYNRAISTAEVKSLHAMGTSCPEPDTANLAGHWTMDETSGTTSADSSANANDLTMYNGLDAGTDSTAGQVGNALQFDATNDYAQSNASIDLTGTNAVTVAAWVNRTYSSTGGNTLFEFSTNTNSFDDGFGFFPDDRFACGTSGYIMMMHRGDNGYNSRCFTQPSSGVWHHLVAIYDKSQNSDSELSLYIDGIRQTSIETNFSNLNNDNTNGYGNHPLFLSTRGGTIEFNANTMDDFRIYDRALTPTEIASLYGNTSTCTLSTCSNPLGIEREIVFNTSHNVMQYCNGGSWIAMGPPSDGGTPCTSPTALAGELRYNADLNVLQYCEGDEWMAVTGHVQ